jgi:anti-anti-sigma factor
MDEALTLETRHEPGCAIVAAAGEIDISTVTALRECLLELDASGRPLVADLHQVTFIDASGLNVLVAAANRAAAHGSSLHVVCARPRIRQLFRVTGLNCRIPLARTLDDARETLAATAHDHDHVGIVAARSA